MNEMMLCTRRMPCGDGQGTTWAEFNISKIDRLVMMSMHISYGEFDELIGDAGVLFTTMLYNPRAAVDKLIADIVFTFINEMADDSMVFTIAEATIAVGKAVDNQLLFTLEEQVRTLAAIANLEGEEHEKRGA